MLLPAALLCAPAGCGSGPTTGQVTGKVTLNRLNVGGAQLAFQSTTNPDDLFVGTSSANGNYSVSYRTLDGLPTGRYKVTISIFTLKSGVPFPPGEQAEELKDQGKLVAANYEFEQDIAAGSNTIDFELSNGKKL
jgi:hypothetical protein